MLIRPVHGTLPLLFAIVAVPPSAPQRPSVTVPFLLDHNRVFVDLDFVRPDGTNRRARFLHSGGPVTIHAFDLAKEKRQ
jgi:hypothetical protein